MKLYRIEQQSNGLPREWLGTQDEAKKRAREIGGFWEIVEVPTDKPGLLAFLNAMEARVRAPAAAPPPEPVAPTTALSVVTPDTQRQWDGESIANFLLDRATVAQVENIFAAIGTRFAEARTLCGAQEPGDPLL
jgi:hypothetical protein